MKDEQREPVNIYINIIFGDVTNSSVIQGGARNTALLTFSDVNDMVKCLMKRLTEDTS
jgi:hypothetical protein